MNRRTQAIIGIAVVAIGIGVVGLGLFDSESGVRDVATLMEAPQDHTTGTFTLIGTPQAEFIPGPTTTEGQEPLIANAAYQNQTQRVVAWVRDGVAYHSTLTLHVEGPDEAGVSTWTFTNETREPGMAELAFEPTEQTWTIDGPHAVFLIQGFPDDNGVSPVVFAVYRGVQVEPLRPKLSQFEGHVLTTLPDGTPLPDGAAIYGVDDYTQQCSSKLVPDGAEEEGHPEGVESA